MASTEGDLHHTLPEYLQAARKAAGSPSLRTIAGRTEFSHTTVAKVFAAQESPLSWPIVEQVSVALSADTDRARALWLGVDEYKPHSVDGSARQYPAAPRTFVFTAWLGVLFVGGVAVAVTQAVSDNNGRAVFITDLVQAVFMWAAAAIFATRAHRARSAGDQSTTLFLSLLAVGCSAWACGQTAWFISRNIDGEALPNGYLHDVGYLLMPPCVAVALWMRARHYGAAPWDTPRNFLLAFLSFAACTYAATVLMLSILHVRVGGLSLLYALYPATDVALSVVGLAPIIVKRRVLPSGLLAVGFLAAGASDFGYLILKADPSTTALAPAAALGYFSFTVIAAICASIVKPLPEKPEASGSNPSTAHNIASTATAVSAALAVVFASAVAWRHPATPISALMFGLILAIATTLAAAQSPLLHDRRQTRRSTLF